MNLSIELKGTYHIDINDIVLKEIIEQYDGNYKEYLKNIKVDNEEINWFIEQKDYKTNQLEKALDENIEISCINLLVLKEEDFKKIYNAYYKKDLGKHEEFIINEDYENKILKSGFKGVNIFMSYLL